VSKEILMGVDIGTTSVKTVLINRLGEIISQASQEYPTAYPHPGWAQQDPEDWWRAVCLTMKKVLVTSRISPQEIAGVGASCQAPTLVVVDERNEPIYPALIWMDRRSDDQCDWLRENLDESIVSGTNGGRIDPYYLAPKILWLRENEPDIYRGTRTILQANGFIVNRLCGTISMDLSHGPLTLFFDSRKQTWSSQLMDAMHIDPKLLPPLYPCAQIVGEVCAEASDSTGLAKGTPLIAGTVDGAAAALEAGLINRGDAVEMTGQSTVLLICSDQPYFDKDLIPLGHAIPGKFLVVGAMVASGGALRWFRDQLGEVERKAGEMLDVNPFELLSLKAASSPPGSNHVLFLPYMCGERSPIWDSDARGVFFGLTLATKKTDLIRAIMEGSAFGLRHNMEVATQGGFIPNTLSCVGGGSQSQVWNQIKADILNMAIRLPRISTGAPVGVAIIVAVATSIYPSIEEAVKNIVIFDRQHQPNHQNREIYDRMYDIYVNLYPVLKDSFKQLADIAHGRLLLA
jgi:xylulokinase